MKSRLKIILPEGCAYSKQKTSSLIVLVNPDKRLRVEHPDLVALYCDTLDSLDKLNRRLRIDTNYSQVQFAAILEG